MSQTENISIHTSIELERINIKSFIKDCMNPKNYISHVRLNLPPGLGKSYFTTQLPALYPNENFIYIVPSHKIAESVKIELHKHGVQDIVHVKGKKQLAVINKLDEYTGEYYNVAEKLCKKPDGEEYYPGCKGCEHFGQCEWSLQFDRASNSQVIITTIHNIQRLGDFRIVVYDESFDNQIIKTKFFNAKHINLSEKTIIKTKSKHPFAFYDKVELLESFKIHDEETYFLSLFFESYKNIHAYKDLVKGSTYIYGELRVVKPFIYDKIIFCCATTTNELMFNITDIKEEKWKIYEPLYFNSNNIINPMIKFSTKKTKYWSKEYARKNLPIVFGGLKHLIVNKRFKLLVITKKDFVNDINRYFPEADIVYYGNGRGYNDFNQHYDLVIVYGNYGMTDLNIMMLESLGFSNEIIRDMEKSEIYQCIHRCRPLLHPDIPFLVMTDYHIFPGRITISFNGFKDYIKFGNVEGFDYVCSMTKMNLLFDPDTKSRNISRPKNMMNVKRFLTRVMEGTLSVNTKDIYTIIKKYTKM